jgi:hypothetical protein
MNWPDRKDIPGILIIAIFLAGVVYASIFHPGLIKDMNHGFGPEWECLPMQKGDPICFKRETPKSGSPTAN